MLDLGLPNRQVGTAYGGRGVPRHPLCTLARLLSKKKILCEEDVDLR